LDNINNNIRLLTLHLIVKTKIMKTFLIEDFFHLPPVSTTPMVHIELRISPQIFYKNLKWALMGYSGAWGKLIREKTSSRKSFGTVPLNSPAPVLQSLVVVVVLLLLYPVSPFLLPLPIPIFLPNLWGSHHSQQDQQPRIYFLRVSPLKVYSIEDNPKHQVS
jgi:hypothetical protein